VCAAAPSYTPSCQVGTATAGGSSTTINAYLVPPNNPADAAGFDLVPAGGTAAVGHAELSLRQLTTGPAAGQVVADLTLASASFLGSASSLTVNVNGTLNGKQFVRMPSACALAASSQVTVNYGGSSQTTSASPDVDVSSTCTALPFSPRISSSASKDKADNGASVQTSIAQAVGEAAPLKSTLTTPAGTLSPNTAALSNLCKSYPSSVSGCTPVGSATVTSPLVPSIVTIAGSAYLVQANGALSLAIVFPPPFSFSLVGTIGLATNSLTFGTLPDVPLTSLIVQLNGGRNALFTTTCKQPSGTLSANFTAQNGKTHTANTTLTVSGCKASGGSVSGRLSGLGKRKPRLSFRLAGSKLKSFSVSLPGGLSFNKSKIRRGLKVSGGKVKSVRVRGRQLIVALKKAVGSVSVTLRSPGLRVSKALSKRARKHRVKTLTFRISEKSGKKKTRVTLTVNNPS
jgi:hypothetical protein